MFSNVRKPLITVAALAALALGGSALADAASSGSSKRSSSSTATTPAPSATQPPPGRPGGPAGGPPGRHVGANGKREQPLTGEVAAKVRAAALAKVSGGTAERVETDVDHGSPYEAHVRKSDGTEVEVLVNKDFKVTAVKAMRMR